jgi:hypothetical protein
MKLFPFSYHLPVQPYLVEDHKNETELPIFCTQTVVNSLVLLNQSDP